MTFNIFNHVLNHDKPPHYRTPKRRNHNKPSTSPGCILGPCGLPLGLPHLCPETRVAQGLEDHAATFDFGMWPCAGLRVWLVEVQAQGPWWWIAKTWRPGTWAKFDHMIMALREHLDRKPWVLPTVLGLCRGVPLNFPMIQVGDCTAWGVQKIYEWFPWLIVHQTFPMISRC